MALINSSNVSHGLNRRHTQAVLDLVRTIECKAIINKVTVQIKTEICRYKDDRWRSAVRNAERVNLLWKLIRPFTKRKKTSWHFNWTKMPLRALYVGASSLYYHSWLGTPIEATTKIFEAFLPAGYQIRNFSWFRALVACLAEISKQIVWLSSRKAPGQAESRISWLKIYHKNIAHSLPS